MAGNNKTIYKDMTTPTNLLQHKGTKEAAVVIHRKNKGNFTMENVRYLAWAYEDNEKSENMHPELLK